MEQIKTYLSKMSVTWKFLLAFYSIIIIPVIFLGFYLYVQTTNTVISQAQMVMAQNIAQTKASILQNVKIIENTSQIIAYNTQIQAFLDNGISEETAFQIEDYKYNIIPIIENVLRQNKMIQSMRIYMPNGTIPEVSDNFYSLDRVKEEKWCETIWNNKDVKNLWRSSHASQTYIRLPGVVYTNPQVFSYYREIISQDSDKPVGIQEINIREDVLFSILRDSIISEMGNEFVVDSEGVIVSDNIHRLFGKQITYTGIKGVNVMSGINRIEKVNGVESIVITMPVNEINCSIVGIFPISHFNGKAKSTIITIILVITASSMLIGIFIYIATSALLGRVRMLAKAMRQVRNGKMDIVLPISSQDEFGELTISFNHMTKHINDLIETVYKIQIMEREAELKALEAQINPHFLYNTLATVAWSGRMANAPEVVDISNSLARFYRLVLSKGKTRISVKEELEMVKEYLYIQKIRFVDLLEVKYDVDKNVLCYSTMKNLLQPIVENALSHGIQPKRYRGTIIVKAKAEGNHLVYTVIDDGVGMNPETLKGVMEGRVERSHGSGYAIKNVMDRLRTFYGDDSSVEIFSRPGIGTTVTIRIMRSEPLCVDL